MRQGRPWHKFKSRFVNAFQMYSLSLAFGWTPRQIRNLDSDDYMMYISILKGVGQANESEEK